MSVRSERIEMRAATAAVAVLGLLVAGCGSEAPDTDGQGLAVASAVTTATTEAATETTESTIDPTADQAGTGSGADTPQGQGGAPPSPSESAVLDENYAIPERLEAGLAQGEIRNLIIDVHGPTDDVGAELARIGPFPAGVPSLPGSDLREFSMRLSAKLEPPTMVATATMWVDASAEEAIAFYEQGLQAPSFTRKATSERTEADLTVRTLEYATLTSEQAFFVGLGLDFITGDFDGTLIVMSYSDIMSPGQATDAEGRITAFRAWGSNPPFPSGGEPRSMSLQTTVPAFVVATPSMPLTADIGWVYPGRTGSELAQVALDSVAASDYAARASFDGTEPGDELSKALAAGDNFLIYWLDHPTRTGTKSMTVFNLNGASGDPYLELSSGSVDLFSAP